MHFFKYKLFFGCFIQITFLFARVYSEFKKCSDSSFCMKLRSSPSSFSVIEKTIMINEGNYVTTISSEDKMFLVDINVLDLGIVSFHVKDPNPSHALQRYRLAPGEILVPPRSLPNSPQEIILENCNGSDSISYKFGKDFLKILIRHFPFDIEIFRNDIPVLTINSNSLLHIEENSSSEELPENSHSGKTEFCVVFN